ncbi:MAG: hypothetical protein ISQ26_09655 [Candidatus Puniceispirillum sp.]|nr:hypothetical protein [Candidatus Puniceispirillum sp.]
MTISDGGLPFADKEIAATHVEYWDQHRVWIGIQQNKIWDSWFDNEGKFRDTEPKDKYSRYMYEDFIAELNTAVYHYYQNLKQPSLFMLLSVDKATAVVTSITQAYLAQQATISWSVIVQESNRHEQNNE